MGRFTERDDLGGNQLVLRSTAENEEHIEPWCISTSKDGTATMRGAAVDSLAEYEDLEEQGKLLKLPCPNWMDIVFGEQEIFWAIDTDYIENPIREITVDSSERLKWYDGWKTVVLNGTDENGFDWEFSPEKIGKTVFLTKPEAERALQEMSGKEKSV